MSDYYLMALTLTLVIEWIVVIGWANVVGQPKQLGQPPQLVLMLIFVAGLNLVTHPLAWHASAVCGVGFWIIELLVVMVEGTGLAFVPTLSPGKAMLTSLTMNTASMVSGFVMFW